MDKRELAMRVATALDRAAFAWDAEGAAADAARLLKREFHMSRATAFRYVASYLKVRGIQRTPHAPWQAKKAA